MNKQKSYSWEELRSVRRGGPPVLDTASIMDAVRREAFRHPVRRETATAEALRVPTWVCALVASLAVIACSGVAGQSFGRADQQISNAWVRSIQPTEFAQSVMPFDGFSL